MSEFHQLRWNGERDGGDEAEGVAWGHDGRSVTGDMEWIGCRGARVRFIARDIAGEGCCSCW